MPDILARLITVHLYRFVYLQASNRAYCALYRSVLCLRCLASVFVSSSIVVLCVAEGKRDNNEACSSHLFCCVCCIVVETAFPTGCGPTVRLTATAGRS